MVYSLIMSRVEEDAPSLDLGVEVEFKLSDLAAPLTPPATTNHSPKEIEEKRCEKI